MSFKKLTITPYPPRQWALVGDPGAGKSTLAAQMAGPLLVVDADHRFGEVAQFAAGDVFEISDVDAQAVAAQLRAGMAGSGIKTIVIDSLTAIISPLVTQAILENDAGVNKNRVAGFKAKALSLRLLQDSITNWGTDVLWIYHLRAGLDSQARATVNTSISAVELARLRRSLNMSLRVDIARTGQRQVTVDWARRGRYPLTLIDDSGTWQGMPQRIEAAVYDGLSQADQDQIEQATPTAFSGPDAAIAWGFEQGCFNDAVHAQNAYDELKREKKPSTAAAMWDLWINEVRARVAEKTPA